ncbi:MAG: 30S ribosomal protein S12 methylthiotransferase RimO [Runella slithyformis]|nr:MAG: 30S ribosomal protein S12 methylthiotransferase RimO [Runella slithyformis]TAE98250.1 MAG: 30S ribosomal protein S12 methylthiotransferase RimO [Runella slithyformis]TAF28948.1 MAG: 30S ribosomal protein S12 methylthiotransferase RimO [Runella slithyformis]TAF48001.1 MAG: 30S ribosomal protein S12 methylthiotransferase RimO [Runella slithyformis]TAF82486.1 MAG: 30S ribosomal protein S12 methylthiotransferase RimO [Runella slithyformis]
MKTKGTRTNKVNIVTLGCSKNIVDSEVIYTQLKGNGYQVTHESKKDNANIVIINTCGFIDNAKEESVETILRYADAKEAGIVDKVYVTGCLSHRYKDELSVEIPSVDAWFGTNELPRLLKTLKADYKHELIGERLLTTPAHYAYLKIAEGCDRPCSFCAIPLMRGGHVSTPIEQLLVEAKSLARRGTKELILIAQDLTYYGLDLYKKRELASLLDQLADVEGIEWIRLQYAYPSGFPLEVLDVIKNRSNVCNYLDMPLQAGSTELLKIMRRGITRQKTEELVQIIRDKVPDIALRTTLIAGHPGETEAIFEETIDFVERMRFDRLGVFTYSHEEQTHAHNLPDDVPAETKQQRADDIMAVQQDISWELNQKRVGQTHKVLFDRKEGGYFVGRTQFDSPEVDNEVLVPAAQFVRLGDFAQVKINRAEEFDLYGDLI